MAAPDTTHWLRDWWTQLTMAAGVLVALWRRLVVAPMSRLAAVETGLREARATLDEVRDGLDELRVAQARMSDVHSSELNHAVEQLTARIDAWAMREGRR